MPAVRKAGCGAYQQSQKCCNSSTCRSEVRGVVCNYARRWGFEYLLWSEKQEVQRHELLFHICEAQAWRNPHCHCVAGQYCLEIAKPWLRWPCEVTACETLGALSQRIKGRRMAYLCSGNSSTSRCNDHLCRAGQFCTTPLRSKGLVTSPLSGVRYCCRRDLPILCSSVLLHLRVSTDPSILQQSALKRWKEVED